MSEEINAKKIFDKVLEFLFEILLCSFWFTFFYFLFVYYNFKI